MDRRVPFVAGLPRGSHGRQPRAANSVSSIHLLCQLCTVERTHQSVTLCKLQPSVPSHLLPHRVLWEESREGHG